MPNNNVLSNYVKFYRGTPAAFAALAEKNSDTLYFIADTDKSVGQLYLGNVLIAGNVNADGSSMIDTLAELNDVSISALADKHILVYDATSGKWVNKTIIDLLPTLKGADENTAGEAGLVPAPKAGDQDKFLKGDGTWSTIEIPDVAEAQIFEVTLNVTTDDAGNKIKEAQTAAITRIVGEATPVKGDIVIVKDPIADDKFQYTAYVYNGTAWAAMDGNYNAKNVFFDQDFTFTKAIGTVTIPSSGSTVVDAEGKNVYEFFAGLFAAEAYPSTPSTSASITSSNIGAKEVGTNIEVAYSFSTTANAYKYGPANDVKWTDYSATFNGETKTTKTGTFTSVQVTDDSDLSIVGSVEQSAGAVPVSNLGNPYPSAQIQAKSWTGLTPSAKLTGYRAWFCGYKNGSTALADPTAITGDQIRNLGSSANGSWLSSMDVSQMQQMFFAAPAGKGYKPKVEDSKNGAPQTVLGPITVKVKGANNYATTEEPDGIDYDVWYVSNTSAASGSATLLIGKA